MDLQRLFAGFENMSVFQQNMKIKLEIIGCFGEDI
jgi:hypothetical protein